ncbi:MULTISPECIES: hypothetical protein [Streptococcus]|uniref:Phage protein n=1 Tax=Streptococcus caledonicus TaxID=2614158 RepID=A0ABW0U9C9_9STRE|nr:hypothetical protein [Streptococcus sp. S784/96/1]
MINYYVSGKIATLDLGATISAENPFMAAIVFKERYDKLLDFGSHTLQVIDVEEVQDGDY